MYSIFLKIKNIYNQNELFPSICVQISLPSPTKSIPSYQTSVLFIIHRQTCKNNIILFHVSMSWIQSTKLHPSISIAMEPNRTKPANITTSSQYLFLLLNKFIAAADFVPVLVQLSASWLLMSFSSF